MSAHQPEPSPAESAGSGADPKSRAAPRIEVIAYAPDRCDQRLFSTLSEIAPFVAKETGKIWIDVEGVSATEIVAELERILPLHPVAADLLREGSARTLVEDFGTHMLATMVFVHDAHTPEVIDFIFNDRLIITVQERPGDCFHEVRQRLRTGAGRVRELHAEFLFSLLGRAICRSYQPIIELVDQRIERLEDQLATRPDRSHLGRIHVLRSRLVQLRQRVVPLRESIVRLVAHGSPSTARNLALRGLYDELASLQDELDFQRDAVQRLSDLYMNGMSNRLNDVMRILTIISTVFMPLSFIASIYGMNFDRESSPFNMPELGWRYGYLAALGLMASVAGTFCVFFWRRGWIGDQSAPRRSGIDGLALDVVEFVGLRGDPRRGVRTRHRRRGLALTRARAEEAAPDRP